MWLQLFLLFLLPCAQAQAINLIHSVTAPSTLSTDVIIYYFIEWTWTGTLKPEQTLNNVTMELITGAAEDNGNDIVDIIFSNFGTIGGPNRNDYAVHISTPPGPYHFRVSGTVFDVSTQTSLYNTSAVSNTVTAPAFKTQCRNGTFVPVRSLMDPAYSPVRLSSPNGGDVLSPLSLGSGVRVALFIVDIDFSEISNVTAEMVNTVTGASLGVQAAVPAMYVDFVMNYNTSGLSVPFGPYKIRTVVTGNSTLIPLPSAPSKPAILSFDSEEFYVMSDADALNPDATCAMFAAGNLGPPGGNSTGAGASNSTSAASGGRRPLQIWGWGFYCAGLILVCNVWAGLFLS